MSIPNLPRSGYDFSRDGFLTTSQKRFAFWKPAYVTDDLDPTDYDLAGPSDYGWGLPMSLQTHVADLNVGVYAGDQDGINTQLNTLYGAGGAATYMERYRESCISSHGNMVGFLIPATQIMSFVDALGLVGLDVMVYDGNGDVVGVGPYPIVSVSQAYPTESIPLAYWITVIGDGDLITDWTDGANYLLQVSRETARDTYIIDDMIDPAVGAEYATFSRMADTSYGFFAEVDGVTYFGALKSELNPSENGKAFIRWNMAGGARPDPMIPDRIRADAPLRGMVGADNILWVFTDKSLTGYIHQNDIPQAAIKLVGQTIDGELQSFVYEDRLYFFNDSGFYRATREGVQELSYPNRDAFRTWVSDVGIANIKFGVDQREAVIYLNASKRIELVDDDGPFCHWAFDTKSDTMQYFSWNDGTTVWAQPVPGWNGYDRHTTDPHQGLVSVFCRGDELLGEGFFLNGAAFGHGIVTEKPFGGHLLGTIDSGISFRRKLVIGQPDEVKILRAITVKLKYNVTISGSIILSFLTDLLRDGSSASRTVLVTLTASTSSVSQTYCRLPFKELSFAVKGLVQANVCPIEYILLEFEPYSGADEGASYGQTGEIYFG